VLRAIRTYISIFILGCATAKMGNHCALVSEGDGWLEIAKPEGIAQSTTWYSGRFILWYQNSSGHVLACEREYRDPACSTVGTIYLRNNGQWKKTEGNEIIVCN
jgi:hypothetical protein